MWGICRQVFPFGHHFGGFWPDSWGPWQLVNLVVCGPLVLWWCFFYSGSVSPLGIGGFLPSGQK